MPSAPQLCQTHLPFTVGPLLWQCRASRCITELIDPQLSCNCSPDAPEGPGVQATLPPPLQVPQPVRQPLVHAAPEWLAPTLFIAHHILRLHPCPQTSSIDCCKLRYGPPADVLMSTGGPLSGATLKRLQLQPLPGLLVLQRHNLLPPWNTGLQSSCQSPASPFAPKKASCTAFYGSLMTSP